MKTNGFRLAATIAALTLFLSLGACAGKKPDPAQPAPLDTPADLWAEVQNLKSEMRRINAQVEELNVQVKSRESAGGAELTGRVARLESQMTQMASQLAVDIEGAPPVAATGPTASGPAAMTGAPALPYSAQTAATPAAQGYAAPGTAAYGLEQGDEDYEDVPSSTAGTAVVATRPTQAQAPVAGAPVLSPPKDPADALYTNALQSFNNRQYREALSMWSEFTKNFSKNPLIPNTYFWMGECSFQLGDFANAVLSYQEVIDKYPKSTKYP
ncbi:MAG: tetratricopeptide repeat protein, partial [Desulfovibrio sp.]|nr:tetratricopeptide repeat protein [Desulfovibrio sp.]